jgi:hypothetical protein
MRAGGQQAAAASPTISISRYLPATTATSVLVSVRRLNVPRSTSLTEQLRVISQSLLGSESPRWRNDASSGGSPAPDGPNSCIHRLLTSLPATLLSRHTSPSTISLRPSAILLGLR